MTQHLIVLGFAKCGTSMLHEVFKQCGEFHTPIRKETNFFNRDWHKGLQGYFNKYANYEQAKLENKIFVDSSPCYLGNNHLTVLKRIKLTLGDSAKFIICLRNPIYRAFSHYKHFINAHYARYGHCATRQTKSFPTVYNQSFFDDKTKQQSLIFESYINKIKAAEQILGKENILYFILENDAKNFQVFYRKLCDLINIDYQGYFENKPLPKILVGDYISHYIYSQDRDFIIPHNNKIYSIPKGLLLINPRGNEIYRNLSEAKAMECLSASYRWTSFLPKEIAEKMFIDYFGDRHSQLEEMLNIDLSSWNKFKDKLSPKAEFSPQYIDNGKAIDAQELDISSLSSSRVTVGV